MITYDVKRNRDLSDAINPGKVGGAALTAEIKASSDTLRRKPSLSMIGLLLVEIVIGYEWFMSGLVKLVQGDFPAGLAELSLLRNYIEIKNCI